MSTMIGPLRYRVTLEELVRTAGDGGTAEVTWVGVSGLFARIAPIAGREIVTADGMQARVTHEVIVRAGLEIKPQMRFRETLRVLEIRAVLDLDGRGRWLKCLCEERLP